MSMRGYSLIALVLVSLGVPDDAHADGLIAALERADVGDAEGFYRLGLLYEQGRGTERDLSEAARHYLRAAEMGHTESRFALGLIYLGALPDSPRDDARAFGWFEAAARQGHARASYFLALAYENGAGTDARPDRALEWYRRAASRGQREALFAIARIYATGAGVAEDLAQAHAWNQLALARGHPKADALQRDLESRMSEALIARASSLAETLMPRYGAP